MKRVQLGLILSLSLHFCIIAGLGWRPGLEDFTRLKGNPRPSSALESGSLWITAVGGAISPKSESSRTKRRFSGHGRDRLTTRTAAPSRNAFAEFDTEDYGFEEGNDTVRERYLQRLVEFFESRKVYPESARAAKQNGRVEVGFVLGRDGTISGVKILTLSAHAALNRAALALVRDARRFRPIPKELGIEHWKLMLPIEYQLAGGIH
ncbi:MAG: TonB family protein [Bacteriovoracia bacterium]